MGRHGPRFHGGPDALGHDERAVALRLGEDHPELLAAEAPDDVGLARHLVQGATQLREDCVPGGVAVLVVDLLEVVGVDHEDREGLIESGRAGELTPSLAQELSAGEDAGQVVDGGPAPLHREHRGHPKGRAHVVHENGDDGAYGIRDGGLVGPSDPQNSGEARVRAHSKDLDHGGAAPRVDGLAQGHRHGASAAGPCEDPAQLGPDHQGDGKGGGTLGQVDVLLERQPLVV